MTDIRTGLNALADAIDELKQPKPTPEIGERALSGNVIHGGLITHFSSVGIRDKATDEVVRVADDGLHVEAIHLSKIEGTVDVAMTSCGTIDALPLSDKNNIGNRIMVSNNNQCDLQHLPIFSK